MKLLNTILFGILLITYTTKIFATNVNGRFVVQSTDSSKLKVLLQINTNTGSDDLGGATFVIGFNSNSLNFNGTPQANSDYVFHNFSGGNYSPATVTNPSTAKLWLNIDLPFNNSNNGLVVSGTNGWTDVATLFFDIINPSDTLKLNWLYTNPYWGIYDANNITLWSAGTFQNLNYVIINDITPPEIVSASLLDSSKLEILFSESVESSSALNLSNYSINKGINVISGYLSSNQRILTLNTSSHLPGENYTIIATNVLDLAGNSISLNHNSAEYIFITDITPPQISGIIVTNNQCITVKFSERLDPNSAKNKNNFSISNSISIISAQLLPDSTGIKLKTSKQTSDFDYTITVSNIKDRSGNIQSPNPNSKNYRIPKRIKGRNNKNSISKATTSGWAQNYSPDKMIDGYGLQKPDSRWLSAKLMPDTITYDFDENVSMDSLRISFYKGESGRLYKYSLYSSNALDEWTPIVEDIWSEESEWTEIEFDSISTKSLKLVLTECNQGNRASIWEFESFGAIWEEDPDHNSINLTTFELLQNYPNPFNPSTQIKYTIPSITGSGSESLLPVSLKVYDILGNEVLTLVNEEKPAGRYEVVFNSENLASGIYIYHLKTTGFSETKKMVLLR